MTRLNEELARSAAIKASYRESDDEDGLGPPDPLEQSNHNKRKPRTSGTALLDQGDDGQNSFDFSQKPSRKKKHAAQDLLKQSKPPFSRTPDTRKPLQRQPVAVPQDDDDRFPRSRPEQRRTMTSSGEQISPEQNDLPLALTAPDRVRLDQVITDLEKAGKDTLIFCDTRPLKSEPKVHPPALDLTLVKLVATELSFFEDSALYGYLTSNNFLPCIAQWKKECIDDLRMRSLLLTALPDDDHPFIETAKYLAETAPDYIQIIDKGQHLKHPHAEIMLVCVKYVRRLKRCTMSHFMHFLLEGRYPHLEDFVYRFCAQAMLTVFADLRLNGTDGFFAVMLDSRFAEPMTMQARSAWDELLISPGTSSGSNTKNNVSTIQAASIAYAKSKEPAPANYTEDDALKMRWKAEMECWQLKNEFVKAAGERPGLLILVPPEVGQTEVLEARKHEKKAGFPPKYKRKLETTCDDDCRPRLNLHSRDCTRKLDKAQDEWQEAKGYDVEAEVPDQDPNPPSFTFQQSIFVPQEQVITRFNQRNAFEPFSDEEKLVALKRFREVLDGVRGKMIDRAFEWTMIAEVLPCRGVADCVRFYYENKHVIFMKLEKAAGHAVPLVLSGKPEWSPNMSAELQRRVRNIFDIDRFLQYIADLEANNTTLRLRNSALEKDEKALIHSQRFHRKRGDRHKEARDKLEISNAQNVDENQRLKKQLKALQPQKEEGMEAMSKQLKAFQLEKDEEIEQLKKQVADSQAYGEDRRKFGEWQDRRADANLAQVERLKEELKEAKQQLRDQQPRATGHDFLKRITHTHTPKQWRGER